MFSRRTISALIAIACLAALCAGVSALEVDSGSTYCFSQEDFSGEEPLTGICIMELPDASAGTVMLGSRVLRPGDILTAEQMDQMTFIPLKTQEDLVAQVTYLPIYENRVATSATMVISIRGKEDKAPVAEDSLMETYKNLPNQGKLKVSDPEGGALVYTVTRQPRRGEVTVNADGTFLYTPKKNKVGVDSFTYTATDPSGKVSREATVTVRILKPTEAEQYSDTVGSDCRFAAEWMKNTGLFIGEKIGGALCFNENKTVTKGEFVTMMIKALGIPVDSSVSYTGYTDQLPDWLKPYLAAALRSGITAGLPASETGIFAAETAVTGGEAAVMLANAMDLSVVTAAQQAGKEDSVPNEPAWAMGAVEAMNEQGFSLQAMQELTRGEVAMILYQISLQKDLIPGLAMYQ